MPINPSFPSPSDAVAQQRLVALATPANEEAWRACMALAANAGDYAATVEAASRVLELFPRDVQAWTMMLNGLVKLEHFAEAADAAYRAIPLLPELADDLRGLRSLCQAPHRHYYEVLQTLHTRLKPATYVEIGVFQGRTLTFAAPETRVFGIDPQPKIGFPLSANTTVFPVTSDAFFESADLCGELSQRSFEFGFIDGLHIFDQALRDFVNLERLATPSSVIAIHDCLPADAMVAERTHTPTARLWAGDVWKTIVCLKAYRPDLTIRTFQARPTGIALVSGLDPSSSVLSKNFSRIVSQYADVPFSYLHGREVAMLNVEADEDAAWAAIFAARR